MPRRPKKIDIKDNLEDRTNAEGRRRLTLTANERRQLTVQQQCETAAVLFLDTANHHSWLEIAQELGMTPNELKTLTKRDEFQVAYNNLFAEVGHDPRYKAAKGKLADMLPSAVTTLEELVTSRGTAGGVRLKAALEILRLNGVSTPDPQQNDRQELAEFLRTQNINIEQLNIAIPPEYLDAYKNIGTQGGDTRGTSPAPLVLEGQFADEDPSSSEEDPEEQG